MIVGAKVECARILAGQQSMIIQRGDERRWTVGGEPHPVQRGAFGPVVCHVPIIAAPQIPLGQLTEDDARLLGFSSLDSFRSDWRRRHDGWVPTELVWALRFHFSGTPTEYMHRNLFDLLKEAP